jgi:hypothetical protein
MVPCGRYPLSTDGPLQYRTAFYKFFKGVNCVGFALGGRCDVAMRLPPVACRTFLLLLFSHSVKYCELRVASIRFMTTNVWITFVVPNARIPKAQAPAKSYTLLFDQPRNVKE